MDNKKWYASKTIWINALTLAGLLLQSILGIELDGEAQVGLLAVVNLALRTITKGGVTLR